MPMPRKIPEDQDLIRLLREGKTYAEIADWCRENLGTDPVPGAVANYISKHRDRLRVPERRRRYDQFLPWMVEERHARDKAVRMLRVAARLAEGQQVDRESVARFETWRQDLEDNNWVVAYNHKDGFYYSPRKPGDEELIRPPKGLGQLVPA